MSVAGAGFKLTVFCILLVSLAAQAKTIIYKASFNEFKEGTSVEIYTLRSGKIEARITTYGGIIVSLRVPDRKGNTDDVVLGYDSLSQYVANSPFFGAIIGRYGNRIAHGSFTLDGKTYSVPKNNGENSLHGGTPGFDKVVWKAKPRKDGSELTYVSKAGDQRYPATLTPTIHYTLSADTFHIEYFATTDKATVVNLTNHSYFNLAGQGKDTSLQHQIKINASHSTPVESTMIPTKS